MQQALLIEPFYGGSHKQLIDLMLKEIEHCHAVTLAAKKWPWRARVSALQLSQVVPRNFKFRFASLYLTLLCLTHSLHEIYWAKYFLSFQCIVLHHHKLVRIGGVTSRFSEITEGYLLSRKSTSVSG